MKRVKIYTRTGDKGETSLYGGRRVEKYKLQVSTYGTIDELNSSLGVVISQIDKKEKIRAFLVKIQDDLLTIGASIAGSRQDLFSVGKRVIEMEKLIDELDKNLAPLKNFILPGGAKEAAFVHMARSICRRAERKAVELEKENESSVDREVIIYLNRLSDLLFEVARYLNKSKSVKDIIWKGK